MKTFEFNLQHDGGAVTIRTRAANLELAEKIILATEGAPKRAIQSWRIVPTARQIRRTQNLMRSL